MFLLYKLAGSMIVPPGLFVIILLALAYYARKKKHSEILTGALCLFAAILYIMSTSAGALLITGPLETLYKAELPSEETDAAILVLAGGSSYDDKGSSVQPAPYAMERLYAAVKLAKSRPGQSLLILSGGNVFGANDRSEAEALRDAARAMGYDGRSVIEKWSRTTAENMSQSAKIIQQRGLNHVIIVTNAFHIPRSMLQAERQMPFVQRYPYPSGRLTDPVIRCLSSFLPNSVDLNVSCLGIREWVGIAAYKIIGLLKR
ncbi:MAG: YdcF family protein [Synergistaceae bacterium]|nr:YdcF family protein [Synergistaceae bacterium]